MPVHGLPMMLECLINNILEESHLSSFKVAGNKERTTLVLRFDAVAMADMCVSTKHQSTPAPASYRKKSPSQVRRDKLRQQHHHEKLTTETATISTNTDFIENNETTTDDIQRTEFNNNAESSPSIDSAIQSPSSSTLTSLVIDTPVIENTAIETRDQQHNTATETKHIERNTHVSDTDSEAEDDNENTTCDENSRPTTKDQQDDCSNAAYTSLTDSDTIKRLNYCEETIIDILKIKKDTGRFITQRDRNNTLLKLVLDKYQPTQHAIIAETNDLILEYSIPDQRLVKFFVKDSEDNSSYTKMRKRHISNWPDETILIREDYGYDNHVQNIRSLLPHLKHLIIKGL